MFPVPVANWPNLAPGAANSALTFCINDPGPVTPFIMPPVIPAITPDLRASFKLPP